MVQFQALVRRLDSLIEEEVIEAAYALGDLGDRRAVPILIQLLQTTQNRAIKNASAVALRELADPVALDPILQEIRDPKNVNYTGTLVWSLETLNARSAVVDLAWLVCDGAYESAWMAVAAIRGFEGPLDPDNKRRAVGILEDCLQSDQLDDWRAELLGDVIEFLDDYEGASG